jgi:hypothetical protein
MAERAMKLVAAAVVGAVFAGAVLFVVHSNQPSVVASPVAKKGGTDADHAQLAQLTAQLHELQLSLTAVRSQLAARQDESPAGRSAAAEPAQPAQSRDVEAERAAEAEKHREYMATVAQAFASEKSDPAWANRASSRVDSVFGDDNVLRNVTRRVECRQRSCRVEVADEAAAQVNERMQLVAMGLADLLPNISAEHVDQADGHRVMVLYMSSQPLIPGAATQGK